MGFMDKVKNTLGKNADKAGKAIDKGADLVDKRTGRKHSGQIGTGAGKAKDYIAKLGDEPRK